MIKSVKLSEQPQHFEPETKTEKNEKCSVREIEKKLQEAQQKGDVTVIADTFPANKAIGVPAETNDVQTATIVNVESDSIKGTKQPLLYQLPFLTLGKNGQTIM